MKLFTMDPDKPALRADGTLKDASEIDWVHSPSADSITLPFDEVDVKEAPPATRNLRRVAPSAKYIDAIAAEHRNSDDDSPSDQPTIKPTLGRKRKGDNAAPPLQKRKYMQGDVSRQHSGTCWRLV